MSEKTRCYALADQLGQVLLHQKWRCATAESCTGGGVSMAITEIPGSSQWFDRGFVTYTNDAKQELLNISPSIFISDGAVSEMTVRAMAEGAIFQSNAAVSVAISGVAGPGGGTPSKPVGTVWIGFAGALKPTDAICYVFKGDRAAIRQQAVEAALKGLIQRCGGEHLNTSTSRYFFALWPSEKTAEALYERYSKKDFIKPAQRVALKNLHVTLCYLGRVTPDFLKAVLTVGDELHGSSFNIVFSSLYHWSEREVCCLGSKETPDALSKLVMCITRRLVSLGFKPERRPYIPHITIARHCNSPVPDKEIPPISWEASDFCLVKSTGGEESDYEIIQRWSLAR